MPGGPTELAWRVLVIDDESAVQLVLERLFARLGQRMRGATSSAEGAAAITSQPWDLVLIDKNLPDGSGLDLARAARLANPGAVLIMITAFASRDSADALVGVVDEYITKPFELNLLREVISSLMSERTLGRSLAPGTSPSPPPTSGARPTTASRPAVARPGESSASLAPARARTVRLDSLHIVVADAREEASLLSAARQTGFSASSGPILDSTQAEIFIIDGRSATLEVRKAVWHRQAMQPTLRVLMLVDVTSTSDSAAAVALKAWRRIPRPLSAEGALALLTRLRE